MEMKQPLVLAATALGVFAGMYALGGGVDGVARVLLGLGVGTVFGLTAALYLDRARR